LNFAAPTVYRILSFAEANVMKRVLAVETSKVDQAFALDLDNVTVLILAVDKFRSIERLLALKAFSLRFEFDGFDF
jgi:hypothetical protein